MCWPPSWKPEMTADWTSAPISAGIAHAGSLLLKDERITDMCGGLLVDNKVSILFAKVSDCVYSLCLDEWWYYCEEKVVANQPLAKYLRGFSVFEIHSTCLSVFLPSMAVQIWSMITCSNVSYPTVQIHSCAMGLAAQKSCSTASSSMSRRAANAIATWL